MSMMNRAMERSRPTAADRGDAVKATTLKFVILIGVMRSFADMTYEGARSITGPYLAILGASGAVVGVVAGIGELLGYGEHPVGRHSAVTRQRWEDPEHVGRADSWLQWRSAHLK
jgi:hypothetical protein